MSAPEFGSINLLSSCSKQSARHTQSQPDPSSSLPPSSSQEKQKHLRTKSVPTPVTVHPKHVPQQSLSVPDEPQPTSPTDQHRLDTKKTGSPNPAGSPKPKRNILEGFRNTLRPRNKSSENTGADSRLKYNGKNKDSSHSMPSGSAGSVPTCCGDSYANLPGAGSAAVACAGATPPGSEGNGAGTNRQCGDNSSPSRL